MANERYACHTRCTARRSGLGSGRYAHRSCGSRSRRALRRAGSSRWPIRCGWRAGCRTPARRSRTRCWSTRRARRTSAAIRISAPSSPGGRWQAGAGVRCGAAARAVRPGPQAIRRGGVGARRDRGEDRISGHRDRVSRAARVSALLGAEASRGGTGAARAGAPLVDGRSLAATGRSGAAAPGLDAGGPCRNGRRRRRRSWPTIRSRRKFAISSSRSMQSTCSSAAGLSRRMS